MAEARAALGRGDWPAAESACRSALAVDAHDADALATLGYVLHAQGRFAAAEAAFDRLTRLDPDNATHWVNLGAARRGAGDAEAALLAFARAAALGEASAAFYFNVGLAHLDRTDYESGRAVFGKAAALDPADAEIRYYQALCCYETLHTEEAVAALAPWERLTGLDLELLADIGLLLMKLGDAASAEAAIRRALQADPSNARIRLAMIQLLERTNRVAEATRALQDLESEQGADETKGPDFMSLQAHLAQRNGQHARAAQLFEALLARNPEPQRAHLMQFPLAKSQDALGRHDAAFATLQAAHESQALLLRMTAPLAWARGAPAMTITRYGVDPADVSRWRDDGAPPMENSPVFIVAFPRSGTTLLELTLDAHPALRSMDEQPFVQNALDDMLGLGVQYPEALASLTATQLEELRGRYWRRARDKVEVRPQQRIVDKNPLNILRLPVIRRLFPHSPIILVVRHPCDVILSCYQQHFRTADFALLCRDLPTLARGYRQTFDFWYGQQELLGGRMFELRYENFVDQFEQQLHALLEFLQLPWHEALGEPQHHARSRGFISTPSYSQVVEPVHKRGIDRWRRYETHFTDVLHIVRPYLMRWGYAG